MGIYKTWTLDSGLDSGLDRGLTAIYSGSDQLNKWFHYNITVLLIYTNSFLIQNVPHLNNNIYDERLMKSFHGADADDDSDWFI